MKSHQAKNRKFDYNLNELIEAYREVGVSAGKTVYLTGNFGRLGKYQQSGKQKIFEDHLEALFSLLTNSGTVVVPTHSFSLCNTDKIYDHQNTPSETGPFTEYIRKLPGSVRQVHPFSSSTAIGKMAEEICTENSRHVYGWESPFQRMIDRDTLLISIGKEINKTVSIVHHVEMMMGVPYRYTKEFDHPCVFNGVNQTEKFYLYVLYRECDIERDKNIKIIQSFRESHEIRKRSLGRSTIESLSSKKFFDHATKLLSKDIYAWLKYPPRTKPYTK